MSGRVVAETAEMIRSVMREKGITQKQLAVMLGLSKSRVCQILSGKTNLTIRSLSDVLLAMGMEARFDLEPIGKGTATIMEFDLVVDYDGWRQVWRLK